MSPVIMRHPRASVGECTRPPAATQHLDPNASDPTAASRRTLPTCDALPACTSTVVYGMKCNVHLEAACGRERYSEVSLTNCCPHPSTLPHQCTRSSPSPTGRGCCQPTCAALGGTVAPTACTGVHPSWSLEGAHAAVGWWERGVQCGLCSMVVVQGESAGGRIRLPPTTLSPLW